MTLSVKILLRFAGLSLVLLLVATGFMWIRLRYFLDSLTVFLNSFFHWMVINYCVIGLLMAFALAGLYRFSTDPEKKKGYQYSILYLVMVLACLSFFCVYFN